MNWDLIGSVAAGLIEGKRQADQAREVSEYRKTIGDLNKARAESLRRTSQRQDPTQIAPTSAPTSAPVTAATQAGEAMGPPEPVRRDDPEMLADYPEGMTFGGMVGYAVGGSIGYDSDPGDWGRTAHHWQKQSFKK